MRVITCRRKWKSAGILRTLRWYVISTLTSHKAEAARIARSTRTSIFRRNLNTVSSGDLLLRICDLVVNHLLNCIVRRIVVRESHQPAAIDEECRRAGDVKLFRKRYRVAYALFRFRLGDAGRNRIGIAA